MSVVAHVIPLIEIIGEKNNKRALPHHQFMPLGAALLGIL